MPRWIIWLVPCLLLGVAVMGCSTSEPRQNKTSSTSLAPVTVQISHPPLVKGQPSFPAIVDFSNLGEKPNCYSHPGPDSRPCKLPLRERPDFESPVVPGFAPVEGQDAVVVECQVYGNDVLSQGTLQDKNSVRSNIWNKVVDARLQPQGYAWGNDVWFGNRGWRDVPCPNG